MHKLRILLAAVWGELLKLYYKMELGSVPYGLNREEERKEKVIVSLTSYGRRVEKTLPFTIISLLRQTYKPDMVLLWLDDEHWNDGNLPLFLKDLKNKGLTIRYCKDIKSYKKLIPTLNEYSNDLIVTCDDDVFYRKNMVERLIKEYMQDPSHIYAHRAHKILFSPNGQLLLYNDWDMEVSGLKGHSVFPTGCGGCLYKRSLLYKDICREDLFMRLAPKADDVWFYFMEVMQETKCVVLPYKGYVYIPLDTFYQYFHKEASLSATNCKESQNDVQIRNVMAHYNLRDSNLINMCVNVSC